MQYCGFPGNREVTARLHRLKNFDEIFSSECATLRNLIPFPLVTYYAGIHALSLPLKMYSQTLKNDFRIRCRNTVHSDEISHQKYLIVSAETSFLPILNSLNFLFFIFCNSSTETVNLQYLKMYHFDVGYYKFSSEVVIIFHVYLCLGSGNYLPVWLILNTSQQIG